MDIALDLLRQLLLFGALLTPAEMLAPARPGQRRLRRGLLTDLGYAGLVTATLALLGGAVLAGLGLALGAAVPRSAAEALGALPLPAQLAIILALSELCAYWVHRASHANPLLWRLHRVHHSSAELDWLSAHRQHPLEALLLLGVTNLPVVALGFDTGAVLGFVLLQKFHTALVHANVRLPSGSWERWIAGPRFHHWHHVRDDRCGNFSSMLPLIDRAFGTYAGEAGWPAAVGLPEGASVGG